VTLINLDEGDTLMSASVIKPDLAGEEENAEEVAPEASDSLGVNT